MHASTMEANPTGITSITWQAKDTSTFIHKSNQPTNTQNAMPKCNANTNERPIALPVCKIQARTEWERMPPASSTQPHATQMHEVSRDMGRGPAHKHHATGSSFNSD